MGGECWGILRIFVKKGMENKGILSQLKALLTGKRGMRLNEYLSEYRSRNLALRRGNSFDSMVGNMEHHLRQCLGSGFATLALKEVDTDLLSEAGRQEHGGASLAGECPPLFLGLPHDAG